MKVLHEKCDPKLAEDRKLPYTAYLVEYVDKENGEDKTFYDITTCLKQTDMFDYYYDKYKKGLKVGNKQRVLLILSCGIQNLRKKLPQVRNLIRNVNDQSYKCCQKH